jgi:hypothetical protein
MFDNCKLCKKELKSKVSKERGYGPECWDKHLANKPKKSKYLVVPVIFPSKLKLTDEDDEDLSILASKLGMEQNAETVIMQVHEYGSDTHDANHLWFKEVDVECRPFDENVNPLAKRHKYGLTFIQDENGNMAVINDWYIAKGSRTGLNYYRPVNSHEARYHLPYNLFESAMVKDGDFVIEQMPAKFYYRGGKEDWLENGFANDAEFVESIKLNLGTGMHEDAIVGMEYNGIENPFQDGYELLHYLSRNISNHYIQEMCSLAVYEENLEVIGQILDCADYPHAFTDALHSIIKTEIYDAEESIDEFIDATGDWFAEQITHAWIEVHAEWKRDAELKREQD